MPDPHDPILTLPTPMTPCQTCMPFKDACISSCLAVTCMLLLLSQYNNQHWLLAERSLIAYAALHLLVVNSFQQPSAENSPRASIYTVHPLLVVVPFIVFPWRCAIMLRPTACINPIHSILCINHTKLHVTQRQETCATETYLGRHFCKLQSQHPDRLDPDGDDGDGDDPDQQTCE